MTRPFQRLGFETSHTGRERSPHQPLSLATWRSLNWRVRDRPRGWWHRRRCSASSPPGPHLSSARNLLTALTCHNCHRRDSEPPPEPALPTASGTMPLALLRTPWQLYPDPELPGLLHSSRSPPSSQNYTGPRLPQMCRISLGLPSYLCKLQGT